MLFDSHCHLNFSSFKDDYKEIIVDCLKNNIGIINVGSQYDTSKSAIEIANQYPDKPVYASIGLHPVHLSHTESDPEEIKALTKETEFDGEKYQDLIVETRRGASKIVAVGEIGLDYWHIPEDMSLEQIKEKQKKGFIAQLKFAQKNNLPVILHARGSKENPQDAYLDILNILKFQIQDSKFQIPGVIHCFGSTLEIAKKFLDFGFYISFTGIITFKNKSVDELREIVKNIPLDKILVETDAPYLSPEPHRGEKNKPQYVEFVARKVAELKNVSYKKVCEITTENTKKLFKI